MNQFSMTINGSRVSTSSGYDVLNPSTGEVVGRAPLCSPQQLGAAVEAADRAYRTWRGDESVRRETLRAIAGIIREHAAELASLLSLEQGKPVTSPELGDATTEIEICAMYFDYYADLDLSPEILPSDEGSRIAIHRRPLGVAALITPWNFPAYLSSWKVAPALRAGNTVVLKPSEFTPLTVLRMGQLFSQALPPGVFNVVAGDGSLGQLMTTHPLVRKISFTGSTVTGKKVAAAAAQDLKRVTLELGGNDPAIVLDDVDVDQIAPQIFNASFGNAGQVCTNIKRVYVHRSKYDEVVEALAELAKSVRVGDGHDPQTQLGPINNRPQFERVRDLVNDAKSSGARVAAGGSAIEGAGFFFQPTILANVSDGTRIVDEEQFGPALPIVSFDTEEEAVARANNSHYGLTASVWSSDSTRAASLLPQLESGTVWTNAHNRFPLDQPFAGQKWSGIGAENGRDGLLGYTQIQVTHEVHG